MIAPCPFAALKNTLSQRLENPSDSARHGDPTAGFRLKPEIIHGCHFASVRHITKEALNKSLLGALPVKSG
ncbi:MAG: hypothetical protein BGO99_00245 [Nitrosospira sp. 56-18]|nr:MAG: hypothetical protein BGO99_00245 [Nitrosospira sp. 56-18]